MPEENTVLFNLFFALIDGFISEENVICSFNCNFKLALNLTDNTAKVIFKDIVARNDKDGYIYNSSFVKTQNADVTDIKYSLYNTDKARKKAMFYSIFLTSWLPVLVFLLFKFLSAGNVYAVIAFLVILILFSIPSWKRAVRLKQYFNDEKATELLNNEYKRLKLNNWNTNIEPTCRADKTIFKILDFIFGKNKHK